MQTNIFGYIGFLLTSYSKRILLTILICCCVTTVYAETLYVVVSDNLRGSSFSQTELKRILLGEITSIKGKRVRLIYPEYTSRAIITLSKFVGKGGNVRSLKSYWSKMIFTGRGIPPETADSQEELRQYLEEDNAIGVTNSAAGLNVVYTING